LLALGTSIAITILHLHVTEQNFSFLVRWVM
jgi:hypothetical protein